MGHIGQHAAFVQYQVDFLDTGIVPVVLEGVLGRGLLHGEEVVLVAGLCLGLEFRALVSIGLAIHGIEGVVAFGVEGHDVVVEEAGLAVGFAGPPALGGVQAGTAAEVTVYGAVPYPVLGGAAADGTDVRLGIKGIAVRVLQGEGFQERTFGDTAPVVGFYLNGVFASCTEAQLEAVYGIGVFLVGFSVHQLVSEDPHGHHTGIVHGEGDIVGLLVHADVHIQVAGLRYGRRHKLRIVGSAGARKGGHCCNGNIFPDVFHDICYL